MLKTVYGTIKVPMELFMATKRKKIRNPRISYNTYTGFQETSQKLNLLNATEYAVA
jgi:hypothetical protein